VGVAGLEEKAGMPMAKIIEFYIPKNFRKPFTTVELGKIIEFCPQTKRSA
jgi:hypothetical protein